MTAAILLAGAAGAGGCGGDEEREKASAEQPAGESSAPSTTTAPTSPSASAPERPTRGRHHAKGERRRPQRDERSSATPTTPESPPKTTTGSAPPRTEPEAERERTTPKRTAPPAEPEQRVLFIEETATLKLVKREGTTYWQEGTVTGTLSGKAAVRVTIGGPGVISTFTVTLPNGTIRGRGTARIRPAGKVVHYKGTASITGGTGTYAQASGRDLRYGGTGAADASKATAQLAGKMRY